MNIEEMNKKISEMTSEEKIKFLEERRAEMKKTGIPVSIIDDVINKLKQ